MIYRVSVYLNGKIVSSYRPYPRLYPDKVGPGAVEGYWGKIAGARIVVEEGVEPVWQELNPAAVPPATSGLAALEPELLADVVKLIENLVRPVSIKRGGIQWPVEPALKDAFEESSIYHYGDGSDGSGSTRHKGPKRNCSAPECSTRWPERETGRVAGLREAFQRGVDDGLAGKI